MKRFTKFCIILSVVLFVIGLACVSIGKVLGFNYYYNNWSDFNLAYKYNWITDVFSNMGHYIDNLHYDEYDYDDYYNNTYKMELDENLDENLDDLIDEIEEEMYDLGYELEESDFSVTGNMDINCKNGAILIEKYHGDTIKVQASSENRHFECYCTEDTLVVKDKGSQDDKGPVKIYLPEDIQFEEVNIDLRTGSIINIGNLSVKDLVVSCDYGSVKLLLKGNEDDYGYTLSSDFGAIILDGEYHYGVVLSDKSERVGEYNLNLDVKMGSIKIDFGG